MPRRSFLWVHALDKRIAPAALQHSLFPDPTGPQSGAQFGYSIAVSGNYRVVGAPLSDVLGVADVGQVFVFNAATNSLVATLNNPTPAANDQFGIAVAVSGNIVVVGASQDDTAKSNAGAAYVYDLSAMTTTVPVHTLINPAPSADDLFGNSVSVSGNYVVVGANTDDMVAADAGSAYVYNLTSMTPTDPAWTLDNPTASNGDLFGNSVAVSGNIVVVGASSDDTNALNSGSAYVYDLSSITPTVPIHTINNPSAAVSDLFGTSVAVAGNIVVVGTPNDDTSKGDAGSGYVYDLNSVTPTIPLRTLNNPAAATSDFFGTCVAVSGTYVVVGAYRDDAGKTDAGSAYVYDLNSVTPTVPVHTFNNPAAVASDQFGCSIAVSGNFVSVGANLDDAGTTDAGSMYLYDLNSTTPTVPIAVLDNPTNAVGDSYGISVAVSGKYVVVGAYQDDIGATDAGSAYVYDISSMTPTVPILTLSNPSPAASDNFGISVAVSNNYVVVGANQDDTTSSNAGSAYVYDLSSMTPANPIATLINPTPATNDTFGTSVAISGTYIVVGAPRDLNRGSAYVYDLNSLTPTTPIATIDNPTPVSLDNFGFSVAISGNYVVAGAFADDTGATDAGSAYVYDLSSMTPTVPFITLNNPTPESADRFGYSVSVSGIHVVVGAYQDNTGNLSGGAAYVYDVSSMSPTTPVATLIKPMAGLGDEFGSSVAISDNVVAVGVHLDDTGSTNSGAVYVYDLNSLTPTVPFASVKNPVPASSDNFGVAVAVADKYLISGVNRDDDQNTDQGSVRVFSLLPTQFESVQVNDGTAQRSSVTSLTINFDLPVTFVGDSAAAFTLLNQKTMTSVGLSAVQDASKRSVTLNFTDGPVNGFSLSDGRYTLTVVASKFTGDGFDGNGDGIAGDNYVLVGTPSNGLFRLFGDADGNGSVSASDFNAFRLAYGSGSSLFDFDNDGQTSASDFNMFRLRYGLVV